VINLSSPIIMRAVTLEHIPASLAPDGSISSAPKKFEVYGLRSLNDENPENLVINFILCWHLGLKFSYQQLIG
jgi:SUN domain-containing protein 1/2